ncbi:MULTISPECIES: protein kinase domain-containing protein [Aerosakkonema]|uniref:protein kinase domain-containing protein n=1 Tax=Aerosakkonema TaxID=1246629 RepID=UPI0035B9E65A
MSYCLTPGCHNPQAPDNAQFCLSCGSPLLLKQQYRSLKPIGKGGFGRTFLAVDENHPSKQRCVIKQLYLEGTQNTLVIKKATQLFHQEAARLNELGKHPQIPALLGHFEQQKRLYLVQEFVDGETLQQESQKGVFNETQIWELLRDLLPVLKYVHDRNILHRDIKPPNIMRCRKDGKLILIDFGVAKVITDTGLYRTGTAVGTPEYVAAEQMKGKALPASDLYSLGVTCIYLLTGVPPLDMFDAVENRWVWRDFLPPGTQVSDRLGRILDKLVKSTVSQRYKSVAEVMQAMEVTSRAPRQPQQAPPPTNVNFFTKLFRPQIGQIQRGNLISEAGIDYSRLQYLLAAGKWEQADKETWTVMCQILTKSPSSYLQTGDIEKLPCEDLEIIDRLWVKFSKGHFGWSVQKQIFELVEEDYAQFCDRIGWPSHDARSPYLKFSLSAPLGHLPSRSWIGGYQWWRHAAIMASKLDRCQIA